MKIFGVIFILLTSLSGTNGTNDPVFPVNEEGKITFEEVVEMENIPQKQLFINAVKYAEKVENASKRKPGMYANPKKGIVEKKGSFLVYTNGLFTQQVHGEIEFSVHLEVEDNQYTYTYTDFVFQHYSKNRHGLYAPVNGKKKPLEDEKYAGMQDIWLSHKKLTKAHIENHIRVLKKQMKEVSPSASIEGVDEEKQDLFHERKQN